MDLLPKRPMRNFFATRKEEDATQKKYITTPKPLNATQKKKITTPPKPLINGKKSK